MGYYALSCLDDAVAATRAFLLPVDRGRWLRLAVVVFFLSGGSGLGSVPSASTNASPTVVTEVPTDVSVPTAIPEGLFAVAVTVAAVVAALVGLYALAGAVMAFVLVDSLRSESVTVRRSVRRQFRRGAALFVFQVLLGAVTLGLVGGLAYLFVLPATAGGGFGLAVSVLLFALVFGVVVLAALVLNLFTVDFVVPTMLHEERGLLDAWRRVWGLLREEPDQFAVYLLVRAGVAVGVTVAGGTVTGVVAAVLAVPFVLVGGIVVLVAGLALSPAVVAVGAVLVAGYLLLLFAAVAVVHVPLKTFVRYYQLLVLGDADPALDLIPERRRSVRSSSA